MGLVAEPVAAQGTPMGTEIVNTARVTWQADGIAQDGGLTAESRFAVARPKSNGVLTAWEMDKGLTDGPSRTMQFPAGDFRRNPFTPLPEPVDRSTLTGDPAPIDRSQPVRVVPTDRIRLGVPIFFTLQDAGLNLDPARIETVVVTLTDAMTEDREELRFYEIAPDAGLFTGWINTTATASPPGDGALATQAFSVITSSYLETTNQINNLEIEITVGPVDPFGILFDSKTGEPVNGVTVTLIDMNTGQPAKVWGDDMTADYPATLVSGGQVTDSSGRDYQLEPGEYRFPFVSPGDYRIELADSDTHAFPSQRPDEDLQTLPGAPFTLVTGSRLERFTVEPGPPLRIDIPLDALAIAQITREASHTEASVGEFLEYTVTVTAAQAGPVRITDTLPQGVVFIPGTMLVDGQPAAPQVSGGGGRLDFDLPPVTQGQTVEITYGAQVVPPAHAGQVLTSYSALGTQGIRPLTADHDLRVRDAMGLDQVAILGQIGAGGCALDDPGTDLSGIRVLLENGEFAITDSDGRFTFRDIYRRPRVVQMDVTTLPPGARPVLCYASPRSAGSAISQFVDLRPGMMARVEFYLAFDEDVAAEPKTPAPMPSQAVERSPLAVFDQDWLDRHGAQHGPGFVAPDNGHLPATNAIDVVYLRPLGATSELSVNGEPVPGLRREPAVRSSDGKLELVRYRAVRITEGRNALDLSITDADGVGLRNQTHTVLYGLRPGHIEVLRAGTVLESDDRTQPVIALRLTDDAGIPIRPGTQVDVTIDSPFGFAPPAPVRRSAPASERAPRSRVTATVQDDGLVELTLAPVLEKGTARLSIPLAGRDLSVSVPISAAARPWVLVGLAEGTVAHHRVRDHMRREGEIGNALAGRVALFAEGVVRGEWLLTLRYDSAQDRDDFYGIDPDADYIVYADRSVQGSAAQSRFPLYLRLRREGAAFLVGDFDIGLNDGGLSLNQKVTGARAVFEDEDWRVMAFAAQTSNRLVEDRIPLNGTVGPYQLTRRDLIPHSQTVRLVTLSRLDSSEEMESVTLTAGVDYVVSYTTGQIYLRRPVAAFTPALHRRILIADYEADAEIRDGLVAGIRAESQLGPRLRMGATAVHARRVEGQDLSITLSGLDLTYRATDDLALSAEVLHARRTFTSQSDTGLKTEVRAEFERDDSLVSAYLRRQRGHVALTASDSRIDTTVAGLSLRHPLWVDRDDPTSRLVLEGQLMAENDRALGIRKRDGEVLLTREDARSSRSVGIRTVGTTDDSDRRLVVRGSSTSRNGRLTQTAGVETSRMSGAQGAADRLEMTFDLALTERLAAFGTFDTQTRRLTGIAAHQFTFGTELAPRDGRTYRLGLSRAVHDRDQGQAIFLGADHTYTPRTGLTTYLGGDIQWDLGAADVPIGQSIGNPSNEGSFAAYRAGLRHEGATWGGGLDTELRQTRDSRTGNLRLRIDGELSTSWSAGGEAFFGVSQTDGQPARHDVQLRASAAHRTGPRAPITLLQGELRQRDQGGIESLTTIASVYRSQYLSDTEFLNLRYGVKRDTADLRTGRISDRLDLVGAEYRRDLNDYFDLGLHGSLMRSARTGRSSGSLGVSLGMTPFDNGWLSVGYNVVGFHDPDFSALGHTDEGAFIQFRMKFDADSLRGMFR